MGGCQENICPVITMSGKQTHPYTKEKNKKNESNRPSKYLNKEKKIIICFLCKDCQNEYEQNVRWNDIHISSTIQLC